MRRLLLATPGILILILSATTSETTAAGEVSGRVTMPDVCTPSVSPAVVSLEPAGVGASAPVSGPAATGTPTAEVALINQRGLQFVPRVLATGPGQAVRFANGDAETHNVHVGNDFNESMAPGQVRTFAPTRPGVYPVLCDVHGHMRAFIVVAATPWVAACSREGRFRLDGVPDGRYVLNVWHEMGTPLRTEVEVAGGRPLDLGTLALAVPAGATGAGAGSSRTAPGGTSRAWTQVIEKIGLLLASSLDAAGRPGGLKPARKLVEDAYWGEFEASDMETAVRNHLGFARAGEIEGAFRAMLVSVRDYAERRSDLDHATERSRKLLLGLLKAGDDLNRKGATDGTHALGLAGAPAVTESAPAALDADERHRQVVALKQGLARVRDLAGRGEADEAASTMSTVYFDEFEPIERFIQARNPQDVRPLEARFNAIRGSVAAGSRDEELAATLAGFLTEVEATLGRIDAQGTGSFGPAFVASFITIVREGAEIILVLAMLIALAVKAGGSPAAAGGGRSPALRAIGGGVALAVVASLGTALALNLLVASAQGRTRELVEGLVMLAASGVLFYVSYWLISQSESRRWIDFLKRRARRGAELGGRKALALTAFLAVYREGAETALMYQAMLGTQGQSRDGLIGLAAGLVVGLVVLGLVALVVRATSVRLPLRAFFKMTGGVLFGMAVVFAGNAIFELQQCGLLKTTALGGIGPVSWLGRGIPLLGLYPNVQTLSVQGLLLAGAALALLLMVLDRPADNPRVGV